MCFACSSTLLSLHLNKRMTKQEFEAKFAVDEKEQRKNKLADLLARRPDAAKLQQLNILKGGVSDYFICTTLCHLLIRECCGVTDNADSSSSSWSTKSPNTRQITIVITITVPLYSLLSEPCAWLTQSNDWWLICRPALDEVQKRHIFKADQETKESTSRVSITQLIYVLTLTNKGSIVICLLLRGQLASAKSSLGDKLLMRPKAEMLVKNKILADIGDLPGTEKKSIGNTFTHLVSPLWF
jgi:hypothetical protein